MLANITIITAKPTAPNPKTATREPFSTFAVLRTAPINNKLSVNVSLDFCLLNTNHSQLKHHNQVNRLCLMVHLCSLYIMKFPRPNKSIRFIKTKANSIDFDTYNWIFTERRTAHKMIDIFSLTFISNCFIGHNTLSLRCSTIPTELSNRKYWIHHRTYRTAWHRFVLGFKQYSHL